MWLDPTAIATGLSHSNVIHFVVKGLQLRESQGEGEAREEEGEEEEKKESWETQ